jgi:ABC-type Fe3+-hydroxamate transport system substrate-binding protein
MSFNSFGHQKVSSKKEAANIPSLPRSQASSAGYECGLELNSIPKKYFCKMEFTDQLGSTITLPVFPRRIVSLVPSQSEFLWDLGLRDELVGVTRFCVHPPELKKSCTIVGGTKKLNLSKIAGLHPDLIIGNKEENEANQITDLQKQFPVWMSDIVDIGDAFGMMRRIGEMVDRKIQAEKIVTGASEALDRVKDLFRGQRVAYFIWKRPYMLAGGNTFINSMLKHLGLSNVAGHLPRYPELTIEEITRLRPDHLLLSSEPYPFKEQDVTEMQALVPGSKALVVDGEAFSWYGSRLMQVPLLLPRI